MITRLLPFFVTGALLWLTLPAHALDTTDTRMMTQPVVSESQLAFIYADDLWLADRNGQNPRQLTTSKGAESYPAFSPDGQWLAFTGQYDGGSDVYLLPAQGGVPKRLTWHKNPDRVLGFTPDGQAVLFLSQRYTHTTRHAHLYTVPVNGGFPTRLKVPHAASGVISPDGKTIAYNPLPEAFRQWKNYRGGRHSRIWLFDRQSYEVEQIPQPAERCNDTEAFYVGDRVYFLSDRAGEFNIFRYNATDQSVQQVTTHKDFPVVWARAGAGVIVYEQAGYIHTYDPASDTSKRLQIGIAADLIETRRRFVDGSDYVREFHVSPKGNRAVFNMRGEIVTVPAEKGSPRNITRSVGAHDRDPAWSPDGQWIAYFSDASGEYQLTIAKQDGSGQARGIALEGSGFYSQPLWSPDNSHIAYQDNSLSLWVVDVETGKQTKVDSEPVYSPIPTMSHDWSPDSRWLTYTKAVEGLMQTVFIFDRQTGTSHQITDGMSEASSPTFDASGKYLYFTASTEAGPLKDWFAMSNNDMTYESAIYMAVLAKDTPSPLLAESDEAAVSSESSAASEDKGEATADTAVTIDFDDLAQRILYLPIPTGSHFQLSAGNEGELYFVQSPGGQGFAAYGGPGTLKKFSVKDQKTVDIAQGVASYALTADLGKLMYSNGRQFFIVGSGAPAKPGDGQVNIDGVQITVDPPSEWTNMYHDAWRLNRDYFYATNFHGVDWEAERDKYAPFLEHLTTRRDLTRLLQWLCSELAVGHHRSGGGDYFSEAGDVRAGLLGCDFEVVGDRYRFKHILTGENWNPNLRAPLTEPGVNAQVGEYLLAVNGVALRHPTNVYALFENTIGKVTELTIGPNADGSDARTVLVKPISDDTGLRNRAWIEDNLRRVHEATDGRVAYVFVPDTSTNGHAYFKRYFYPQSHKDAIIVDERYNRGGQIADYPIDMLRKPHIAMWAMRHGKSLTSPRGTIDGPKVMLIDETAGSGGDLLPFMWRKFDMGPLIGRPTWGGLVGVLGFPPLMDGGSITAPNVAIYTENGWVVENVGVPPDIEVEQLPKDLVAGRDPQLEKAIEVVLQLLEENPPQKHPQPDKFPERNQ